tara:strand:+ start:380 stop:511 length:132 start_codon:yes stop_codon:yes gene_type:complete
MAHLVFADTQNQPFKNQKSHFFTNAIIEASFTEKLNEPYNKVK